MPTDIFGLMPQPQNWLERGMSNPLTHLGMGLLAANQPRMSYNPADLSGGGIGAGLLAGAQSYNSYERAQQAQNLARERLEALRQQREAQRQKWAQGQQQAQQRQVALAQLAQMAPPNDPQAAMYVQMMMTPGLEDEGAKALVAHLGPAAVPAGVQTFQAYQGMPPEQQAAFRQFRQSGAAQVNVGDKVKDTFQAQREYLRQVYDEASAGYATAEAAFKANPSFATKRDFDHAAASLSTAKAGYENFRGEPSEGVARRFPVPGAIGTVVEDVIGGFTGEDNGGLLGPATTTPLPDSATPQGRPANMSAAEWEELQRLRKKYGR